MNLSSAIGTFKDAAEQVRIKARGTELEKRLLEAMSGENWGASSSLMSQIADDTYHFEKYSTIMKAIWTNLDSTTSWRKVFKALNLLEHLLKHGNERVIEDSRDHMHKFRMLTNFNFYEGSIDRGSGVREKSRNLIDFLKDNERIREERDKARALREKFSGFSGSSNNGGFSGNGGGSFSSGGSYNSGGIGSYSSGGIGSYSSGGIGSESFSRDRPTRYSDESNQQRMEGLGNSSTGRYSDEPVSTPAPPAPKPSSKKIDIKIKPTQGSAPTVSAPSQPRPPSPTQDIDLLGGEPSPPPAQPPQQVSEFDAFATSGPGPTPQTDPFQTQGFSNEFGDFASHSSATQPPQFQAPFPQQTFPPQPAFSQPHQSAVQAGFQSTPHIAHMADAVTLAQGAVQQQAVLSGQPQADMFGDFQQPPPNSQQPPSSDSPQQTLQPQPTSQLGGLVDLGDLSVNNSKEKNASSENPRDKFKSHDSFQGLDGFSRGAPANSGQMMGAPMAGMPPQRMNPMGAYPQQSMGMQSFGMPNQQAYGSQPQQMGYPQPGMPMGQSYNPQFYQGMGQQQNFNQQAMQQQAMQQQAMQQQAMQQQAMQQRGMMPGGQQQTGQFPQF